MTHKPYKDLKPEDFQRLYGVNQGTFNCMVNVLHEQVEVGKLADFAILSTNPLTVNSMTIKDIEVLETIKEGQMIYQKEA